MKLNPFSEKIDNNTYKVAIYIPSVDSMQLQMTVLCNVIRDSEDKLLYLVDSKTKGKQFKELFAGEDKKVFNQEEIPKLKSKLNTLKNKLANIDKKSIDNYKNTEKEIYEIEFLISKHQEERGTFTYLDSKGIKCLSYLRKSTGVHPLHYNIHSNNVFQPTETDSRDAFMYWVGKQKSLEDKADKGIKTLVTIFGVFVFAIIMFGLGYGSFKLVTYEQRADETLIQQKYVCQEIYEKGIQDIINTNKKTAQIYQDKVNDINITSNDFNAINDISSGIKVATDILK